MRKAAVLLSLAAVIIAWWLRREDELRPLPNVDPGLDDWDPRITGWGW
jgi:hypothetical protein